MVERNLCGLTKKRKRKPPTQIRVWRRQIGFHCVWCSPSLPHNERFVPLYYRPLIGIPICYDCYVQYHLLGKAISARLSPDTLTQFWMEDVSDGDYVEAAAVFFDVRRGVIEEVMQRIRI